MKKGEKNTLISEKTLLNVKKLIKSAKEKGLVKPHTEAFTKNPVEKEAHKGKTSYFCN